MELSFRDPTVYKTKAVLYSFIFILAAVVGFFAASNPIFIFFIPILFFLATLILIEPIKGLFLVIFSVPFYSLLAIEIGVTISIHQVIVLWTGIAVFCHKIIKDEAFIKTKFDNVFLLFLFITTLYSLFSSLQIPPTERIIGGAFRSSGLRTIMQVGHLFILACTYFITVNLVKTKSDLRRCLNVLFFTVFLVVVFAIFQTLADNLAFKFNPLSGIKRVGLSFVEKPIDVCGFKRASVFGMEPKALAAYLFPAIILFTVLAIVQSPLLSRYSLRLKQIFLVFSSIIYLLTFSC